MEKDGEDISKFFKNHGLMMKIDMCSRDVNFLDVFLTLNNVGRIEKTRGTLHMFKLILTTPKLNDGTYTSQFNLCYITIPPVKNFY